jgi:hypothetical protein
MNLKQNIFSKDINVDVLISIAFGGAVFVFFACFYPFHLHYQEQYQLFLFSGNYFNDYLSRPGGISNYIGNFFTQFYFYAWVGAIIIAVFLTALQRMLWLTMRKFEDHNLFLPLSFVPSIIYWSLLCDENFLLGGLIAFLFVALFNFVYTLIKPAGARSVVLLFLLPVIYWLAGGAFVFALLFALTWELAVKQLKYKHILLLGFVNLIVTGAVPVIAERFFLQYPVKQIRIGVDYFRFPEIFFPEIVLTGILVGITPLITYIISKRFKPRNKALVVALQLLIILPGSYKIFNKFTDIQKEEVMAYDFNVRMRRWDNVIAMADKKTPKSPLSVTCLNLALAQQNMLGEKMFKYYQNGVQGLLPDFTRDYTIPMITGEVYYHLGLINVAQRFAFEAMEALPDYQKSVRSIKRLAETNLINGSYAVSKKYLKLLQKTFYYKKWADRTLELMQNENSINAHPEWGRLRQCRVTEDFLFSEDERDMMLGLLFTQNKKNQKAFEYLLAYCLLTKDLKHFWQYFPMGQSFYTQHIPGNFQEALVYYWTTINKEPSKQIPFPISKQTQNRIAAYHNIYVNNMNAEPLLRKSYSDSYWYYYQFR